MTPPDLASALAQPGTVWLDDSRTGAGGGAGLLFTDPSSVLEARRPEDVPRLLEGLDEAAAQGFYAAGFLAYEAGYAFEPSAAAPPEGMPLAWFGLYRAPRRLMPGEAERLLRRAAAGTYHLSPPQFGLDRAAYAAKIAQIKSCIHAGDVYQINFTGPLTFDFEGSVPALYGALRQKQRTAYGAFLHAGARHVLSCSPELFFRREGDRITTRPMKGTARRGRTPAGDAAAAARLAADAKSRAENLMIVDLLRNDLSRCCRPGSVRVPELFTTEHYETLIQMTSTVVGQLREGIGYRDLFPALFPCGSVTGAPKIRAMEIIRALEASPRGVYCGAIGYVAPDEQACFNVAIRTVVLEGGRGRMGVGSGIVWDSDAAAEYEECLLKARFLTAPPPSEGKAARRAVPPGNFELIETMRWEDGIRLLDLHLARMRVSAQFFGFPFDEAHLRALLQERTAALPPGGACKVRITLGRSGAFNITTSVLEPASGGARRVCFSEERVDAQDVFLRHKTTRRTLYEAAYRQAAAAGFDEVLFLNERGEVTEGSRTNVFIRQGEAFFTPPLASGLLGGVFRRHLLQTLPNASERVLYPDDLLAAEAVYVCNAVWGLVPVEVAGYTLHVAGFSSP